MTETFLLEGFPVTSPRGFLGWANALLLDDGATRVVVDTGGPGDRGTLIRRMQEISLDPRSVTVLILTHLHFDHCLNLDLFSRATVVLSGQEHAYVASGDYSRAGDVGIPPFVLSLLEGRALRLVDGDAEVSPGVTVIPTPGHTPGSLSVAYERGGVRTLACADLVKNGWEFLNGPPSADARTTLERVRPLAARWVPGHDRPFVVEGASIRYEVARELEITLLQAPWQPPTIARWRLA